MAERRDRIQILFGVLADEDNTNAQSLTAREIALHLPPERFSSTFFFGRRPDRRLVGQPNVALLRLAPRLGSLQIAARMLWGAERVLLYPLVRSANRLFWHLRRFGRRKKVVSTIEVSAAQFEASPQEDRRQVLADLERSDRVYAVSDFVRSSIAEMLVLDISGVIPLGVDLLLFAPVDRSNREKPLKVLFVGTLQERKQPHLLLELARRFSPAAIEFHLIGPPLGDAGFAQGLIADRNRDGLGNIHFHGALSQLEIARWMAQCDLFVLPSRLEGLPKVTLEAAASGLPCIVFSDYRTPSVIDGQTGFQVTDFNSLCRRFEQLVTDKALRLDMGRRAAEHARQFGWQAVCAIWERELSRLMEHDR